MKKGRFVFHLLHEKWQLGRIFLEIIVGLSLAWQEFLDFKKLAQTVFVSTEIYLPLLRYGFAKAVVFLLESE